MANVPQNNRTIPRTSAPANSRNSTLPTKLPTVTRGRRRPPRRSVYFGVEGSGKSNAARQFPRPLFFDPDFSTDHLDVARIGDRFDPNNQPPKTLQELVAVIRGLKNPEIHAAYGSPLTLVFDTADKIEESLIWPEVVRVWPAENGKLKPDSIHQIGFAKGFPKALEIWNDLLDEINEMQAANKMDVIFVAHSERAKVVNLGGVDYTTYEPSLYTGNNASAARLLREWATEVFFFMIETTATNEKGPDGKPKIGKGQVTERRLIYTVNTGWCMAKNREGLPSCIVYPFEDENDRLFYQLYDQYVTEYYNGTWLLRNFDEADLRSMCLNVADDVQSWPETIKTWKAQAFMPAYNKIAVGDTEGLKVLYKALTDKYAARGAAAPAKPESPKEESKTPSTPEGGTENSDTANFANPDPSNSSNPSNFANSTESAAAANFPEVANSTGDASVGQGGSDAAALPRDDVK